MRGIIRLTVLLVAIALLPISAAAPPKAPVKKEVTEPEARKLLLAKPFIEGKISKLDIDGDEKTLTVKAAWQVKYPNAEGQRRWYDLSRRYQEALRNRNVEEIKKIADEAPGAALARYDVEETPVDFMLKCGKELKVRRLELPEKEAGADGKPVPYTAKEKAALKGDDPKLPGYNAELKELDLDVNVQIYLVKEKKPVGKEPAKDTSKDKAADKDKAAEKEKPKEAEAEEVPVYSVAIIVIVPEPKVTGGGVNPFAK
jgi:hypothetical protein